MAVLQKPMNFFTGVSHGTKFPLSQKLLASKGGSLLSFFQSRVSAALQGEYQKRPTVDRRVISSFQDLQYVVRQQGNQINLIQLCTRHNWY